jgi:hypothetical protein
MPDAHPGLQLTVTSAGYAPFTDIDLALDGSAWHETVRSDELGRVTFEFLVPLIISIGRYILASSGVGTRPRPRRPRRAARPTRC